MKELALTLEDTQWKKTTITHDRHVARAIVVDEEDFSTLFVSLETIFSATALLSKQLVAAWKQERLLKRRFIEN